MKRQCTGGSITHLHLQETVWFLCHCQIDFGQGHCGFFFEFSSGFQDSTNCYFFNIYENIEFHFHSWDSIILNLSYWMQLLHVTSQLQHGPVIWATTRWGNLYGSSILKEEVDYKTTKNEFKRCLNLAIICNTTGAVKR